MNDAKHKLLRAIAAHTKAAIAYSWHGCGQPEDTPRLLRAKVAARSRMLNQVRELLVDVTFYKTECRTVFIMRDAALKRVAELEAELAQRTAPPPTAQGLVRFKELCKGTRFRYQDGEDVWVVLETHGVGLIAKWDGPFGTQRRGRPTGPVWQSLCCVTDETTDIETLMVRLAEGEMK